MNLTKLSKKELTDIATKKGVKVTPKMTKPQIIAAIEPLLKAMSADAKASSSQLGYSTKTEGQKPKPIKKDEYPIPPFYNIDTLSFMPVDPTRQYSYWEISDTTLSEAQSRLRLSHPGLILKVFMRAGTNITEAASVSVDRIGNWYFNVYAPDVDMWSEIGLLDSNGGFHSLLRSNIVKMPSDKVSNVVDEETWMTVEGDLDKLYQLSGIGKHEGMNSGNLHKDMTRRLSENIASSGTLKDK